MVAGLASAPGCGGETTPDDVLIIVPDYGQADTGRDVAGAPDDGQVERDVMDTDVRLDSVEPADVFDDHGATDTNVAPDESVDVAPDAGPRCSLGKEACNSATGDRMTCGTASTFGRITLSTENAVGFTFNTMNVTSEEQDPVNKDDDNLDGDCPWIGGSDDLWCQPECDDDGLDHFFRVYLIPGDLFSLSVTDKLVYDQYGSNIDFMLKVYRGNDCILGTEKLVSCTNKKSTGSNNVEVLQIKPMTVADAGWYTIVLDGNEAEDSGTYTLAARLFQNSEYTGDWSLCCDYPLE